mgnify:FL=1
MKALADKHRLDYDVFHSRMGDMPSTDVLYRNYNYVVFDTSRYTFGAILDFFKQNETKQHDTKMATYLPSCRSIITFQGAIT